MSVVMSSVNINVGNVALRSEGSGQLYAFRAGIFFNDSSSLAIRSSHNVSSITEISTGRYRINFTQPMYSTNYTAILTWARLTTYSTYTRVLSKTTSYIEVQTKDNTAGENQNPVAANAYLTSVGIIL